MAATPKVPSKHGKSRTVPKNGIGWGRPSNAIRSECLDMFGRLLVHLHEVVENRHNLSVQELTNALNVLGRYGLGEKAPVLDEEYVNAVCRGIAKAEIPHEYRQIIQDSVLRETGQISGREA